MHLYHIHVFPCVCLSLHLTTFLTKEAMNLKDNNEGYMGWFGRRKVKGKWCNYPFKKMREIIKNKNKAFCVKICMFLS